MEQTVSHVRNLVLNHNFNLIQIECILEGLWLLDVCLLLSQLRTLAVAS